MKRKILMVEDEVFIGMEVKTYLTSLGHTVVSIAQTGEDAIRLAEELKPDLVLMDISLLGEMDGIEAAGVIKAEFQIPIIYLTSHTDDKLVGRAKLTEPFAYLVKPVDERNLHVAIEMATYRSEIEAYKIRVETELRQHRDHLQKLVDERTRELEVAKGAAEVANRAKSEFLSVMNHELRTPLNGILGAAEILKDLDVHEEMEEWIGVICDSGNRLLDMVVDILNFAQIDAHKIDLKFGDFDFHSMIDQVEKIFQRQAKLKDLTFACQISDDVPQYLCGDLERVRQILANLISNAIKFTPRGSVTVKIFVTDQKGDLLKIRFDVKDTGVGISAEDQSEIFKPFTHVDSSASRMFEGSGLGLATVGQLCEMMSGSLGVESELDKGSLFWFEIPFRTAKTSPAPTTRKVEKVEKYVLIAHPLEIMKRVIQLTLSRQGYVCVPASSQQEILLVLSRQKCDLMIVDVDLIKTDDDDFLKSVREKSDLPIIGISVTRQSETPKIIEGLIDLISHPVTQQSIIETVRKRI